MSENALMTWTVALSGGFVVIETVLKVLAIGTVPENRRPSSSQAWLLLILFLPLVGFPLYWLLGSPYVHGKRKQLQADATRVLREHTATLPRVPEGTEPDPALSGLISMNYRLTGLPCVAGTNLGTFADSATLYAEMADAVDQARHYVHVEFYIMSWDRTTDVLFTALGNAVQRGVKVRLLVDHIGSRKYPAWKALQTQLTEMGIDWHLMMPVLPLRGHWRRPDLRNHRKFIVADGDVAFLGSHNLIDPAYGSARNAKIGRRWHDLSVKLSGPIVDQVEAVFATDWLAESGEQLDSSLLSDAPVPQPGAAVNALQLVPSGPAFPSEPNHKMFVHLMSMAQDKVAITSPYFVPDEALLTAVISAAYRGVQIELFVGEEADQFLVGHAQRSYYGALLEAGVKIWLYPSPLVMHGKYFTIDGRIGVIGTANMDYRSFALNYEVMMLSFDGDLVANLHASDEGYRARSRELTLEEWNQRSWGSRYVDNVCRLTAAIM